MSLRADRERAMLCVAYETLARRGELVALEVSGEWALYPGRRDAGFGGVGHRLGGDYAGRRVEIAADAVATCGEDRCGEGRDGEGG